MTAMTLRLCLCLSLLLLSACAHGPRRDPAGRPPVHVDLTAQGKQFAEGGDLERAEQYLAGALRTGANVNEVLPLLIRVCIAADRYEAALVYAERYEPQAGDSVELQLVLAALQSGIGQTENARRTLELVLAQEDKNAQAHYMLGELYYHAIQDYGLADRHYRQYLALAPKGAHVGEVKRLLLKAAAVHKSVPIEPTATDAPTGELPEPAPAGDSPFAPPQRISPDGSPAPAVKNIDAPQAPLSTAPAGSPAAGAATPPLKTPEVTP
jgi:tetratricopeptide (TPR) repeat protein